MRGLLLFFLFIPTMLLLGQQIYFKSFSVEDGLPRSGVYSLMEDHNGFIWIGTEGGGASFFDGHKFQTINKESGLIDNNVRCVFQDSEGGFWFGTPKGVSYLKEGEIINFTKENGLEDDFIRYIEEDGNKNVWISTNQGVSVFSLENLKLDKKSKFNFNLPHRRVRSLLFDGKSMWIGTDAGLCRLTGDKLEIITTLNGLSHNRILCLYKKSNNEIYVGTDKGLNILQNGKVTKTFTIETGLIDDRIRAISSNFNGNVLLGTREGLTLLDPKRNTIMHLTEANGLSNNRIRSLISDREGNTWIGTYFGGIMEFSRSNFFSINKAHGILSDQIAHIIRDKEGHIILATNEGISKLTLKNKFIVKNTNITVKEGLPFPETKFVYKDSKGFYWYATNGGISIFNGNEHLLNILMKDGLVDSEVNLIKEINKDEIWIGTANGISIIKKIDLLNKEFEISNLTKADGLNGTVVTFIEKDKNGRIWMGYAEGEINIFEKGQLIKPDQGKDIYHINTGFIDSKNNVWIGTEGKGLLRVTYDSKSREIQTTKYTTADGILSNFIYSIAESKTEKIWIGTEKGACKITLNEEGEIEYARSYATEEGFFGLECNVNSILCDEEGNMWFGTVRGLMFLLSAFENGSKLEAPIHITSIEGTDYSYNWLDESKKHSYLMPPGDIRIPYKDNFLEINFTSVYLSNPKKIEYSWKFSNETEWSEFSTRNYIHFTNLMPGNYTIQIRSKTPENIISSIPTEISFIVIEPFYMNFWFRVFIVLCVVGIGYLIYRWRVSTLKKQKIELELIVENRTEEISNQNEQLSVKNKEITDSINYAKRIQDTVIPSEERMKSLLGQDCFVLFKPKDIVSGDFYWIREIDENTVIFCVADCTGHGVPGAMVSLVGVTALNKAVGEFKLYKPSEILNKVNILLNEAFSSQGKSVSDGMDIAICKITKAKETTLLEFSGGNNPLWVFNPKRTSVPDSAIPLLDEGHTQIGFTIKPNKFGLGKDFQNESFTNHEMELLNGDEIVIFTDGYADQFGGNSSDNKPMGKKFKYSRLKEVLSSMHHEHLDVQKEFLDKTIEEWRGELEQVDDICMVGLKI